MISQAKKLDSMIGKEWMYKQRNITIHSYEVSTDELKVSVETDGKPINLRTDKLKEFFASCLPVEDTYEEEEDKKSTNALALAVASQQSSIVKQLQEEILTNIQKVKKDSKYIPQAKTINESVNTMLNLVNLQLKVLKAANIQPPQNKLTTP